MLVLQLTQNQKRTVGADSSIVSEMRAGEIRKFLHSSHLHREIRGHLTAVLMNLPIVWGFAAFGEEIGYRGYLLNKLAEALGRTRTADVIALLASAVLFGFGHYYKGPAGSLDSAVAGAILGSVYLFAGRNLWACILTHGFIDTVGLFAAYMGWSN